MKKLLFLIAATLSLYAKPTVSTSILPTAYFVKQIAADTVNVVSMVGNGDDPHTYEPRPEQVKALAKSDIYFGVGIEFEEVWLPKFKDSFKNLQFVDTSKGIEKIPMQDDDDDDDAPEHIAEHNHDHSHGHDHSGHHHHDHDGLDPHVWLDPILVQTQAENIAEALSKAYPQNANLYALNLSNFKQKLKELNLFIKNELFGVKGSKFIVYHPSWGYFAKRYDLVQIAIEVEGKEPSATELAKIIDEAKEEHIKMVFIAPAFSKKAATLIATQTGAEVAVIDQLAYEWDDSMRQTARLLKKALSKQ
ncbi:metal ABC transporter solute-binding protein, Zn/Mn family [Campylobacter sp. 19-13652]|uniref:metal ABC transporter solute-binding protein, Zn/Mn family n=1 Tax=Campylobacter sp. 19-13652 TaxID=2840180 RepID=UPI001C7462BF|nr:zinc ABC transporter substrate-binding protein [Campylobacter sp. 19-13652]BCX78846.1 ABC transporter substrate-binding protein [Campylobacter sp. 19-13652]